MEDLVTIGTFYDKEAARGFFEELFAAFPDFDIEVLHIVADDAQAVVQWRATGRFTGTPFQGIHATGRSVDLRGCDVMSFEDGRLRHNTIYYDGLGFARQIGMLPRAGSAADKAMSTGLQRRHGRQGSAAQNVQDAGRHRLTAPVRPHRADRTG